VIGTLFLIAVVLPVVFWLLSHRRSLARWHTINVNGLERRYLLCRSDEGARYKPLLLCFHGGRAQVELLARRSGVAESGQRLGCLVIFPEAKDGWIDLRPERGLSPRDLDFVDALLDLLVSNNQDPSRVFALGISNGGQFVFRLACERPRRFAHGRPQLRRFESAGRPIEIEYYPAGSEGAPVRCVTIGNWGIAGRAGAERCLPAGILSNVADLITKFFFELNVTGRRGDFGGAHVSA
jgi:pimeloyl-ACP methyl ester carboxylesterase